MRPRGSARRRGRSGTGRAGGGGRDAGGRAPGSGEPPRRPGGRAERCAPCRPCRARGRCGRRCRPTCGRGRPSPRRAGPAPYISSTSARSRSARGVVPFAASIRRSDSDGESVRGSFPDPARRRDLGSRVVGARPEQELMPKGRADRSDPPGDRRGREACGPHRGDPAPRDRLRRGGPTGASRKARERCEVAAIRVDGARRALRREQQEIALYLGVGARRGVVMRLDPIRRVRAVRLLRYVRARMAAVVDAPQPPRIDVAVDLGRRERRVPEQLLDRAQVGAALEQVGRVGVAQPVGVAHQAAQGGGVERAPADREEQRVVRAARERRPRVAEIGRDGVRGLAPRAGRRAPCRPCRARAPPPARSRRRRAGARPPRRCAAHRST